MWMYLWAALGLCAVLCLVNFAVNVYKSRQPWPEYKNNITTVKTLDDWEDLMREADKTGALVLVDCYATWCPPCRRAAPVFADWSLKWTPDTVRFAKVDVDVAPELAQELQVRAMPTFIAFQNRAMLGTVQGWNHGKVLALITDNCSDETSDVEASLTRGHA